MDDDRVFKVLSDPSRRLLLDRLFERDGRTLSELESQLDMTRFGVMKHLRLLEEAELVVTRKVGRQKFHYLNPVPITLILDRWIGKYTVRHVGALATLKNELEGENPMGAETMTRPQQVYQVFIKASPERIWEGITRPEFTAQYFYGGLVESDWKPGSQYRFCTPDRSGVMVEGEVLESDPPRKLVQTWRAVWDPELAADPPSRVMWEIEPAEAGVCKLTVVHDQFENETATFKSVAGGWAMVISGLKTLLETGQPLQAAG